MFIVGIWACGLSGKALEAPDYGGLVWDETVAFLLVLYFTPIDWAWHLSGGFGVMFDDMVAAFFTLLCLAGWKAWVLSEGYF